MKEKKPLEYLNEGDYSKILFPQPNRCGDVRGGFINHSPNDAPCKNEATYYVGGKMQPNGMLRYLHCYCERCLKEIKEKEDK